MISIIISLASLVTSLTLVVYIKRRDLHLALSIPWTYRFCCHLYLYIIYFFSSILLLSVFWLAL